MTDTKVSPYISNGTCYVAANVSSDPIFIPCGNDAFGHKSCCQAGDICLEDNACYNAQWGITYLVGCSDSDYRDGSCPDKKGVKNGGWVGLVTCSGSNDWMPCSQDAQPSTLTSADKCSCNPTSSHIVAFDAASTIPHVGSAPAETGRAFSWNSNYLPTVTASPTATPTPSSTSAPSTASGSNASDNGSDPTKTTGTNPTGNAPRDSHTITAPATQTVVVTASPSSSPPHEPTMGLSTGAKSGIGVGAGAGGLAILAALVYFLIFLPRRRKQRQQGSQDAASYTNTQSPIDVKFQSVSPTTPGTFASTVPSELGTGAARPWSMRSELPNNSPSMGTVFEAEGRGAAPVVGHPVGVGVHHSPSPPVGHAGVGGHGMRQLGGHGGFAQGQAVGTWAELQG